MSTNELTWSAFLREPTNIDSLLQQGDVVLRRRDGEALRLSRDSKESDQRQALAAVARLLAPVISSAARKTLEPSVGTQLPWTRFLPDEDRRLFLSEFLEQFEACADLGDFSPLGRLLAEWKNSANAYAEGIGEELKRPVRFIGAHVPRPAR